MVTEVRQTAKKGLGVFTTTSVKKGEKVYDNVMIKVSRKCLPKVLEIDKENLKALLTYSWGEGTDILVIPLGVSQFINHSCRPNCLDGIALRNIKAGSEITENYHNFDRTDWFRSWAQQNKIFVPPKCSN